MPPLTAALSLSEIANVLTSGSSAVTPTRINSAVIK